MQALEREFLAAKYPNVEGSPTNLVTAMGSQNPDTELDTEILNGVKKQCHPFANESASKQGPKLCGMILDQIPF